MKPGIRQKGEIMPRTPVTIEGENSRGLSPERGDDSLSAQRLDGNGGEALRHRNAERVRQQQRSHEAHARKS